MYYAEDYTHISPSVVGGIVVVDSAAVSVDVVSIVVELSGIGDGVELSVLTGESVVTVLDDVGVSSLFSVLFVEAVVGSVVLVSVEDIAVEGTVNVVGFD